MLAIHQVSFEYTPHQRILDKMDFQIQKGEILAVLGESGSGKSTLLRLIYGLEDATEGEIFYHTKKVTGPAYNLIPGQAEMKFVPQEFDLLNSITVAENVGKYLSNFNLPLKKENINLALDTVNMLEFRDVKPSRLSGGQRQRVAIARALAAQPEVLLLDEPYSHLDQPLKFDIRKKIWNWAKKVNCTVVLTTHDIQDAMGFSDEILVLKEGKMIQKDSPENLRNQPANLYVAGLLGEFSHWDSVQMKELFGIEISSDALAISYPEEVLQSPEGVLFEIQDVRFRGRDYLVEAKKGNSRILFYSTTYPLESSIRLKLKNYRLVPHIFK